MSQVEQVAFEPGATVMVFGADTRIGSAVVSRLRESQATYVAVTRDMLPAGTRKEIVDLVQAKRPSVIINCLIDADAGHAPGEPLRDILLPTQVMLQMAIATQALYVHLSTSRIFANSIENITRQCYAPYDPSMVDVRDPWSVVAGDAERIVFQYTQIACPSLWMGGYRQFRYYVLRLSHVTNPGGLAGSRPIMTLDQLVDELPTRSERYYVARPQTQITPVPMSYAAECVSHVAAQPTRMPSGIYHIASSASVTVERLIEHGSSVAGRAHRVQLGGDPGSRRAVTGLDFNQALSPKWWEFYGGPAAPTWTQAVS